MHGDLMLSRTNIKTTTAAALSYSRLATRPCFGGSMKRVRLIDITVGNATRFGASQRSTTRRCASHHIATQRANRWEQPGASRV